MIQLQPYKSPLGSMTMAAEDGCLIGLWFDGQKYDRSLLQEQIFEWKTAPVLQDTAAWLDQYFSGEHPGAIPPVYFHGSPFRRMIFTLLCEVPYGETSTYGALARQAAARMHRPSMSAQAVGGAVGHNPISILVPCHRILGSDGSLTGYAGGLERKRALLAFEKKWK